MKHLVDQRNLFEKYVYQILLKDEKNEFFFHQSLFIIKKSDIKFYKSKKDIIFNFFLNFFKIIIKILFTKKNKINKSITLKQKLIISHFNKSNLKDFSENYFDKIADHNSSILFLNHTELKYSQDIYLIPKKLDLFTEVKIFMHLIRQYFKFKKMLSRLPKKNNEFNLILLSSFISNASMLNIRYYTYIKSILFNKKLKDIYLTFEGHAYERSIIKAANECNHKTFAYQHGSVSNLNVGIYYKLNSVLMPDFILTSGFITYEYFIDQKFKSENLIVVGSNRRAKKILKFKANNYNLLIIPNGSYNENLNLFKFSSYLAKKNKKYKFFFKYHPDSPFKFKFKSDYENLIISEGQLDLLMNICSFAIYSSSSLIIKCSQEGLIPLFYNYSPNEISNVLYRFENIISINDNFNIEKIIEDVKADNKSISDFVNKYYSKLIV